MRRDDKTLIWDLPLRVFHWTLAILIGYAWFSVEVLGDLEQHFLTGFAILTLLIFRLVWGFVGPRHARFVSFVRGPATVIEYLRGGGDPGAYPGHNPLGAGSVLLLLTLVSAQAVTGLFSDDQEYFFGPLSRFLPGSVVNSVTEFHHFNFNVVMAVICLHVAAVLFYTLVDKEPLVPAMLTGYKKDPQRRFDGIASSKTGLAIVVLAVAAGVVYAISTLGG